MYINDNESDWKKTKTSSNFNKKLLAKKRQFSNDFYDPETMKDFTRFTDIININTFGSQPIVMYKKIKRLQSPIIHKKNFNDFKDKKISATSREKMPKHTSKTNYIIDGGLQQKLNKYKNKIINKNKNHSQSPTKKIKNHIISKTNRENNSIKSVLTQKAKMKTKEFIPKTTKEANFKQIFKKTKWNPNSNNNNKKKEEKKLSDNQSNNNKYMSDKNTIENDDKKKNEYINNFSKKRKN